MKESMKEKFIDIILTKEPMNCAFKRVRSLNLNCIKMSDVS